MIEIGPNKYKLLLLDTNIIHCMMTDGKVLTGMLSKFYNDKNNKWAFGISFYSIFELKPKKDIFQKFIQYFNDVPCIIFYPFPAMLEDQIKPFNEKQI